MTDITLDYEPRSQFVDFHSRPNRWSCIVAHRRAGKTVACINDIVTRATYTQKKNARYAYIAPYYRQAKDVAWQYLKDSAYPLLKPGTKPRESELRVELFNGAWITLYGADNPDALRGLYFDGVIMDEYGDCRPSLWGEVVLPTLADRKGWAVFIGTPKGHNHFWQIKSRAESEDNWFFDELRASQTNIIGEDELSEMQAQMTEDQYEQEMECSFEAAVVGTYYASLINEAETDDRITPDVEYDPAQPVHVACDLGFTDSTALWFWQDRPDGIAMLRYHEAHSQPLDYYLDYLDYIYPNYGTIWLPHDARAKTLQTGRSTIELVLAHGLNAERIDIVPKLSRQHGIDAARYMLPKVSFHKEDTYEGVECLRAYRRKFDEQTKAFTDQPVHDWSCHGADAFRYFALKAKEKLDPQPHPKLDPIEQLRKPPEWRLDELFKERESRRTLTVGRMRI